MKKIIFLSFILLIFSDLNSQIQHSAALKAEGYNTPPGVVFGKIDPTFSYADKLNYVSSAIPGNYHEPKFMGNQTFEEYLSSQNLSPETRVYYQEAKLYFEALSPKIKTLFSVEELWHIYYFDASLKNTIKSIN